MIGPTDKETLRVMVEAADRQPPPSVQERLDVLRNARDLLQEMGYGPVANDVDDVVHDHVCYVCEATMATPTTDGRCAGCVAEGRS